MQELTAFSLFYREQPYLDESILARLSALADLATARPATRPGATPQESASGKKKRKKKRASLVGGDGEAEESQAAGGN